MVLLLTCRLKEKKQKIINRQKEIKTKKMKKEILFTNQLKIL